MSATYVTTLSLPSHFQFRTTVISHGWYDLPPFQWEESGAVLRTACHVASAPTDLILRGTAKGKLRLQALRQTAWTAADRSAVRAVALRMLGLTLDPTEFFATHPEYQWAGALGAGRLLRGASAFEDLVKLLATTNCSWSLTRTMVTRLVEALGEPTPSGRRAFPTPAAMAQQSEEFYRDQVRAGYRSRYFRALAQQVADGEIAPERWVDYPGTTAELVRELRRLPGVGPYAAENMAKILGRFDYLGLDSWCLKKFPEIHGPVTGDVAAAIRTHYARYGRWCGLALWLDLTRDWHEPAEAAP